MEIANDFIDGLPFNVTIQDVRFTGSLANYNWSKYSDIDYYTDRSEWKTILVNNGIDPDEGASD